MILEQLSTKTNDELLIQEFKNGNHFAFEVIVTKYQYQILNVCFRFLANEKDAEECSQDTFVRVYKYIDGFQFKCSFKNWVYKIAVNICKTKLKARKYQKWRQVLKFGELVQNGYTGMKTYANIHSNNYYIGEIIDIFINSLSGNKKIVFVLYCIEGFNYDEIVELTGIKKCTIKSLISRTRKDLRRQFKRFKNKELYKYCVE